MDEQSTYYALACFIFGHNHISPRVSMLFTSDERDKLRVLSFALFAQQAATPFF